GKEGYFRNTRRVVRGDSRFSSSKRGCPRSKFPGNRWWCDNGPRSYQRAMRSQGPVAFFRNRFLWRLRAPIDPGEVRRVERWLASARVFLAIATLVAIGMDPSEIRSSLWVSGLLAFYIAQGMIIIIFLRRRQESTPSFRLLVHSADIVWPTAILVFG